MSAAKDPKRSNCPISFSLDIFGDRWTLLVLRDLLLFGKKSFQELLNAEESIASNILSDRLKRLEACAIITRERDPDDGRRLIYRGTEKGLDLIPILLEIAAWGASHDSETAALSTFAQRFYQGREAMIAEFRAQHQKENAGK